MAQLVGIFRLGRDAELRYTQGGEPVAGLALAFNYGQKGQDGNKPSQWLDASLWGKRAEALAPHLTKGAAIYAVINDPHIDTYQKKDGGQGFKLIGRIADIEFAGGGQRPANSQDDGYEPAPQRQPSNKPRPSFDDLDDQIPF